MESMSPAKSNEASQPLSVSEPRFCTATSPVNPDPQSDITLKTVLYSPGNTTGSGAVGPGLVATGLVATGSVGDGSAGAGAGVPPTSSMGSPFTE